MGDAPIFLDFKQLDKFPNQRLFGRV